MQNKFGIVSFIISFILAIILLSGDKVFSFILHLFCKGDSCEFMGFIVGGIFWILFIISFIAGSLLAAISLIKKEAKGIYAFYTIISILLLLFVLFFIGVAIL